MHKQILVFFLFIFIIVKSFASLDESMTIIANEGAVGGGGSGFFIQSPLSPNTLLWDIYLSGPGFIDGTPGDQISLDSKHKGDGISENNASTQGDIATSGGVSTSFQVQYMNLTNLRSFQLLAMQVRKWSHVAPNFVKLIESGNFLSLFNSHSPNDVILPFVKTNYNIKTINEIYVPEDQKGLPDDIFIYPTGYFWNQKNIVFVNIENFNKANLINQAAFILHERLRQIQEVDIIPNEILQKTVAAIFTKRPAQGVIPDHLFEKSLFHNLKPEKNGAYNENSIKKMILAHDSKNNLENIFGNTRIFLGEVSETQINEMVESLLDHDKIEEQNEVRLNNPMAYYGIPALKEGIITEKKSSNLLSDYETREKKYSGHYLLDSNNCNSVIFKHKDRNYVNSFRAPLSCNNKGALTNVGGLLFNRSSAKKLTLEINMHLYTTNDAGSEITINLLENLSRTHGLKINFLVGRGVAVYSILENEGVCIGNIGCNDLKLIASNNKVTIPNPLEPKLVRITLDRESKYLSVELLGEQNLELVNLKIEDQLLLSLQEDNWSYYHSNNAITYSIKEIK